MRKWMLFWAVVICMLVSGCGTAKKPAVGVAENGSLKDIRLVVASDIHLLAAELTDQGEYFKKIEQTGDGKQLTYNRVIVDAFLADMAELAPDAVILPGDMSYNGEKKSHEELTGALKKWKKQTGIPVYAIPGNHDVSSIFSRGFFEDHAVGAATVNPEGFRKLYQEFGYGKKTEGIISRSPDELSYLIRLGERVSLYMLNTNVYYEGAGIPMDARIPEETLFWMDGFLMEDQEAGRVPVVVGHHNLLVHNDHFTQGYTVSNRTDAQKFMAAHKVPLYVSGHMHLWHEAKKEIKPDDSEETFELRDIAVSSLAVNPHQYGIITIKPDGAVECEARSVNVEKYAKDNGLTDEKLLNFTEYAADFFYQVTYGKLAGSLVAMGMTEEEEEQLLDFVSRVNRSYFAGMSEEEKAAFKEEPVYEIWQEKGKEHYWGDYIKGLLK